MVKFTVNNPEKVYILFFLLVSLGINFACKDPKHKTIPGNRNETSKEITAETTVEFKEKSFDFGQIKAGEIVSKNFYFTNTGNAHFLIKNIETSCGCSTADYPRKPVAPGKKEKIEIKFNSSGRYGKQYKEISIFANVPGGKEVITFTADIR